MTKEHPNISVLRKFDPANVAGTADVFAEDIVFHFFNPLLPDLHGDYVGRAGVKAFFEKLRELTGNAFKVNLISITPMGDELVVVHRKQEVMMGNRQIESDVVVVWRIVDGRIAEVWDIPSIHTAHTLEA